LKEKEAKLEEEEEES